MSVNERKNVLYLCGLLLLLINGKFFKSLFKSFVSTSEVNDRYSIDIISIVLCHCVEVITENHEDMKTMKTKLRHVLFYFTKAWQLSFKTMFWTMYKLWRHRSWSSSFWSFKNLVYQIKCQCLWKDQTLVSQNKCPCNQVDQNLINQWKYSHQGQTFN